MKVCTEACLFGAWLADFVSALPISRALDIGTGTGLLSLMVAQTGNIQQLDSIELDPSAAAQAAENVYTSPWSSSINVIQADALQYPYPQPYQLIFTNPPFFEQSLQSPDSGKNLAKHEASLDLRAITRLVQPLLMPQGLFAILLPFERANNMVQLAAGAGLFLSHRVDLYQTERHAAFRSILLFQQNRNNITASESIRIRETGNYSNRFIQLLAPYYLYL